MNRQTAVFDNPELSQALATWEASDSEKGEIFTKPEIVRFMMTTSGLSGHLLDEGTRVLEPSCGHGEFVVAIVEDLSREINLSASRPAIDQLKGKILAYDLVEANLQETRGKVKTILAQHYTLDETEFILDHWLKKGDFLLADIEQCFSHVIGNPPYIRIENIPKPILTEYRQRFSTMSDRADIYIAFFEKSLTLLKDSGSLLFICTDRWIKNQYGKNLRALVDKSFNLDMYVDLYGHDSFQAKVLTYPAITLISKSKKRSTVIVHNPKINDSLARCVRTAFGSVKSDVPEFVIRNDITNGAHPWLLGCSDELSLVRKLEGKFKLIEDAGCKVYIGAATGNNKVFVVDQNFEIEEDRKLPIVTSANTRTGIIKPSQKCIINTYDANGVIDLDDFPKLKRYLEQYRDILSKRHVAKSYPKNWFKTIDRVYPERAQREKLLIPDIKSELTVVHDAGVYHPNNSIYYICSGTWDLWALKAVLISGIGRLFIQTYSTKVTNGFLRFQAQHLRRIRIPEWTDIDESTRSCLIAAGEQENISLAKELVAVIYDLNEREIQIMGG